MNIHSSNINNSQNVETTQTSIGGWMDKQTGVYTYTGILSINKKKWRAEMYYIYEWPSKIMLSKSRPTQKIICDFIHMKCPDG